MTALPLEHGEPEIRGTDPRVTLEDLPPPGPWAQQGACRTAPAELFFPERGDDTSAAKRICARCSVLAECRRYALDAPSALQGVWGGLSARERRSSRTGATQADHAKREIVRRPKGALLAVLEQLTAHPNRWARVAEYDRRDTASSMAGMLRTGRQKTPAGRWEFKGTWSESGGSDLFAKYLGPLEYESQSGSDSPSATGPIRAGSIVDPDPRTGRIERTGTGGFL